MSSRAFAPTRNMFDGMAPAVIAAAFALTLAPGALNAQTATDAAPAAGTTTTTTTDGTPPAAKPITNSTAPQAQPAGAMAAPDMSGDMQPGATAMMMLSDGGDAGMASLTETPSGILLFRTELMGLPQGDHAIHIHETGTCEGPDFKSAGGHLAGDKEHGILNAGGPHPGDMPNFTVGADGKAKLDVFVSGLKMADVMDSDGSAVVIHGGTDDYKAQPAGDAGDRVSCGVIKAK